MSQPSWSPGSGRGPSWGQRAPSGNPYGQPPPGYAGWGPPTAQRGFGQGQYGGGFGGPQLGVPQYGPPPGMPAPRRRNPLRLLMLAAVGIGLVLLAGTVVTNTVSTPASTTYQNDDYKVPPPDTTPPPLPQPETYEEAATLLEQNPFYSQTAPVPVRCASSPINVATASNAQLKSHFEGLMECLVRVWQPPVTGAQFQIVRPTVTIYGDQITTKCGKSGVNAFYCTADQQVYYSNQLDDAVPVVATDKWAADVVMAHEFGHALQARTAILISSAALSQQADDESTQLSYSRRLETQADCLSGMFIRAVSVSLGVRQQDVAGILDVYDAVGDDTLSGEPNVEGNHGLGRSREYWGTTGLGTSEVGKCNTYVAEARLVR